MAPGEKSLQQLGTSAGALSFVDPASQFSPDDLCIICDGRSCASSSSAFRFGPTHPANANLPVARSLHHDEAVLNTWYDQAKRAA
jgi:hypothetical protein